MVLVSYHARTAVVSSEVRRGSLSTDVAHTRRPTIKIMCLSKGRKHAGSRTERNMVELGLYVTSKTLAVQFPSCSSEAIKRMRQTVEYKRFLESLTGVHGTHDGPAGGSASSPAGHGTHDGRVDEGDSSETQTNFGATSLPSLQVTQ